MLLFPQVLDAGKIREFDAPQTLLGRPDSLFASLMKESAQGEEEAAGTGAAAAGAAAGAGAGSAL